MSVTSSIVRAWACAASVLLFVACSSDEPTGPGFGNNNGGGGGDGDGPGPGTLAPYGKLKFVNSDIGDVEAGNPLQDVGTPGKMLRHSDGTLYYVYFRFMGSTDGDCSITTTSTTTSDTRRYDLKVALSSNSRDWAVETVDLTSTGDPGQATDRYGVDAVFNASGQLVISLSAGDSGRATCGSSNLVVATRTGVEAYSLISPATTSAACCTPCPADGGGTEYPCRSGTNVGAWSTIAVDPEDRLTVAFADEHFQWDNDGQTNQGYEVWHEGSGIVGLDPWSGRGDLGDLLYVGGTAVAAYAGFSKSGIRVKRRPADGVWEGPTEGTTIAPLSKIGPRINLQLAPDGKVGLVYHELKLGANSSNRVYYCESGDGGVTWPSQCDLVNSVTVGASFPSLVYDTASRPVIGYAYCDPGGICRSGQSGTRMSWRELNGQWQTKEVSSDLVGNDLQMVLNPETNVPTFVLHHTGTNSAMYIIGSY